MHQLVLSCKSVIYQIHTIIVNLSKNCCLVCYKIVPPKLSCPIKLFSKMIHQLRILSVIYFSIWTNYLSGFVKNLSIKSRKRGWGLTRGDFSTKKICKAVYKIFVYVLLKRYLYIELSVSCKIIIGIISFSLFKWFSTESSFYD